MNKPKIAIIISHPIQHFCPLFVSYAQNPQWDIKVFFASIAGYITFKDPNYNKEISWNNLEIDKFKHEFLNNNALIHISNKIDAKDLGDKLEKYNPDIVLIHGYAQKLQRRAYYWALKSKKKIFYFSDSELRHKRHFLKNIIKKIVLPFYFSKINAFLTIGNANENYYQHYGCPSTKFFRAAYPIDVRNYEKFYLNKTEIRKKIRGKHNILKDEIVCSVVGKLVPWKRQIDIIDALYLLEKENIKRISLFIIGSGKLESTLKKRVEGLKKHRVIFTGFINAHELPEYYSSTDIYIHPSSREPHSVAISETIFMGCPVILSDKCGSYGTYDDVQIGKNGFVYKCGNIAQLAYYIRKLILKEKLRIFFGNNSHTYAIKAQNQGHVEGLKAALIANNYELDIR